MEGGDASPTRDVSQSQHSGPWRDILVKKRPAVGEQPEQPAAAATGEDREVASRYRRGSGGSLELYGGPRGEGGFLSARYPFTDTDEKASRQGIGATRVYRGTSLTGASPPRALQ